jgi:RimJ/RimL family protein N-acetyltransferase
MPTTSQGPERPSDNIEPLTDAVTLPDGAWVPIRPIRPDDAAALQTFHRRLSEQSVYLRFFAALPELADDRARYFAGADGRDRVALVAFDPASPGTIIAVLRYDRLPGTDRAEYAAVVADRWQGRGLGMAMSRRLIAIAQQRGIRTFIAFTLPENGRMRHLFRDLGLPARTQWEAGAMRVEIDLAPAMQPPTRTVFE